MYPIDKLSQLPSDKSYISHEKNVRDYWKLNNIRKLADDAGDSNNIFDFMDGPPFTSSGGLHFGHLYIGALKDSVLRYERMHGKKCSNQIGYDVHGLPVEQVVMKTLSLNTSDEIVTYGIDKFNSEAKKFVNECEGSWLPIFESMGRWTDFTAPYKTMDTNFMESTWWTYKEISKKGLTYKGYKVMPYSTALESPLSNFEASQNYKEKVTNSVYVCFNILSSDPKFIGSKIVAWTTTPWTLLSNVALCVGPNIEYVIVSDDQNNRYIVAKSCINNLKINISSVVDIGLGSELVGLEYQPIFNYIDFKYHKILADSYVKDSVDIGSGIVHISPSHGEDDCRICLDNNILTSKNLSEVCLVDSRGKYTKLAGEYVGMYVFDADKQIIKKLRELSVLIRIQEYHHQYPYCYRSDTPLLYMAISSYFIEVSKIKDRMVELNELINWTNKEIGNGRFKNWLSSAKDWCVSRNRFFGTPIPVWESEDQSESITIGSIDELVQLAKLSDRPNDLHLESVANIEIISNTGNKLKHCGLVLDCWFESGNVPISKIHYPFENSSAFDNKEYLCDFVAEGLDQTRGWFYTLLVISTIIFDRPPFKTVICSGIILDENGQKFSKKYGNFVDPTGFINEHGSDFSRLYLLKSPLINGDNLMFKVTGVRETFQSMTPYVNVVKFFLEHYINSQKRTNPISIEYLGDAEDYSESRFTLMDLWILEKVYLLRKNIESFMINYRVDCATKLIIDFVEDLANWYVKFNRDRLKGIKGKDDYENSLSVLFTVLIDYCIISAPFVPFLSEHIYQYLGSLIPDDVNYSVHMEGYPNTERKHNMTHAFEQLQKLAKLIRYTRDTTKTHTSVRIPIKGCTIYWLDEDIYNSLKLLIPLIEDEINCQNFTYIQLDNDSSLIYTIKPNLKEIGKTFKSDSKIIIDSLTTLSKETLKEYYDGTINRVTITNNNKLFVLDRTYFDVAVAINIVNQPNQSDQSNIKNIATDGMLVSLDMTYDEETHYSYQLKNLISFIQNKRKEMKLNPWDKIHVTYYSENSCEKFETMLLDGSEDIFRKLGTNILKSASPNNNNNNTYQKFDFFEFKNLNQISIHINIELNKT